MHGIHTRELKHISSRILQWFLVGIISNTYYELYCPETISSLWHFFFFLPKALWVYLRLNLYSLYLITKINRIHVLLYRLQVFKIWQYSTSNWHDNFFYHGHASNQRCENLLLIFTNGEHTLYCVWVLLMVEVVPNLSSLMVL